MFCSIHNTLVNIAKIKYIEMIGSSIIVMLDVNDLEFEFEDQQECEAVFNELRAELASRKS